jgi:hypothetical protein
VCQTTRHRDLTLGRPRDYPVEPVRDAPLLANEVPADRVRAVIDACRPFERRDTFSGL